MKNKELKIAKALKNNDLSLKELETKTNIDKFELYNILKNLIKFGFVINYYQKRKDTKEYSFYQLTSFGKDRLKYNI